MHQGVLDALVQSAETKTVPHEALIKEMCLAVHKQDRALMKSVRARLIVALGPQQAMDAIEVCAEYQFLTRTADATGLVFSELAYDHAPAADPAADPAAKRPKK